MKIMYISSISSEEDLMYRISTETPYDLDIKLIENSCINPDDCHSIRGIASKGDESFEFVSDTSNYNWNQSELNRVLEDGSFKAKAFLDVIREEHGDKIAVCQMKSIFID